MNQAAQIIKTGGLLIFPTETVFGIAADASNSQAIERVYAIKGRDAAKSLSIMVKNIEMAREIAIFTPLAEKLASKYMPGAITIVVKLKKNASISPLVTQNGMIGIRIPDHEIALDLLRSCNIPIIATSANISGADNLRNINEIKDIFANKVDMIIEGKLGENPIASTVVDCTGDQPLILRQGKIIL